uniref:Uncharacterized protein n=1 Tax=Anguilla anguilla TaxID=7936 RepID=A0A0E9U276_ANGAN
MSSLEDLHSTKEETSVTTPLISMETTFTGMATVRPVRTAVLMISVSIERGMMACMSCWTTVSSVTTFSESGGGF